MTARPILFLDGGTTQTRAWLVQGDAVLAEARVSVGARDTARDGSPTRLRQAVARLVAQVSTTAPPDLVVAAGMITSPQGLVEVPHVDAPAGPQALAAGARTVSLPDLAPVPFLFVPGVRSGPDHCDGDDVASADVMRGEEVLALGLPLHSGGVFLNLGSHWKAVSVDAAGNIAGSVSTLSGELIHAVQTQTILASAVPPGRPAVLAWSWLLAGARAFTDGGLSRALYCVRLLEQRATCTADERMAFLVGAVIAGDRISLVDRHSGPVLVVGSAVVAGAWARALTAAGRDARVVGSEEIEAAFRSGCRRVLAARGEDG